MVPTARRVAITGMGVISPLGSSLDELWNALVEGRSGVGPLSTVPTRHLPTACGGEARQFRGHIDEFGLLEPDRKKTIRKGLKVMCRKFLPGKTGGRMGYGIMLICIILIPIRCLPETLPILFSVQMAKQ